MKLSWRNIILLLFISISFCGLAQDGYYLKENSSKKISFELINNLIVVPMKVNNVSLSFVLDTGVSKPILFNIAETDSVGLKNTKTFFLYGLGGDGKLEALKSSGNSFKFGDVTLFNKDLYVVYDNDISFTPRLGVLVHGIIGYDIFKNFIVELNYSSRYIRLHKPEEFKRKTSKKWNQLPLDIYNKKPYLEAKATLNNDTKNIKLLMDTGSSDALWLFEDISKGIYPNEELVFDDYLGKGLSGSVYGQRSRVNTFEIGSFKFENANVAFPDSSSVDITKIYKERNGSVGGEILKRFNYYFDYGNSMLYLKKNGSFKNPFTYNNSGIVLEHNGIMFVREEINVPIINKNKNSSAVSINQVVNYMTSVRPAYEIVEIRESSNAYSVGLRKGDVLIGVNNKKAYEFKLSEINELFHGKTGKTIRLRIERQGVEIVFKFKLDDAFKKNKPSTD